MKCKTCNNEHLGDFGSGIFCSRKCANTRSITKEHREKTSKTMAGRKHPRSDEVVKKWRQSILKSCATRTAARDIEIMSLPFDSLSQGEKRKRVLTEQEGRCVECGITQVWNNKILKFEFDHISGNRNDNSRKNLRFLCPNCHSQTPTFKKGRDGIIPEEKIKNELMTALTINKALRNLGMSTHGKNYDRARRIIKKYNIDGIK